MGETTALDGVITAIVQLGTDVASGVMSMISQLLPVFAPVMAAIIIVYLGRRLISRFGN